MGEPRTATAVIRRRAAAAAAVLAATLASLTAAGCGGSSTAGPGAGHPDVVLISIDTLRPDRLGCYGHDRPTSPHLDAFRRDAALFTEAIAQAPSTLPSHASMLTSLLPEHHGASFAAKRGLADGVVTLAEVLRDAGYATASFNNGGQLDAVFGLDRGFDLYREIEPERLAAVVDPALAWLDQRPPDRPFFLFLHSYHVHHPYTPAPADLEPFDRDYGGELPDRISIRLLQRINARRRHLAEGDLAHIEACYEAEIHAMDATFGHLIDELRRRGLYHDAVVVFTSDHGEEFGEHGRVGWHSHTLYDELLRVPLLVKLPEGEAAGVTVEEQVRLVDLAPTVLEAVGLSPAPEFSGRSLLADLSGSGSSEPPPAISQLDVKSPTVPTAIRTRRWKLIGERLFDLEWDPGETTEVTILHPEIAERLREELRHELAAREARTGPPAEPDDEDRARLRALGYLQ